MNGHRNLDGTRDQSGLGPVYVDDPPNVTHGPIAGTVSRVYLREDPANPHGVVSVDVTVERAAVGGGTLFKCPVFWSNAWAPGPISPGQRCLVWFIEGMRHSPFVFGFAQDPRADVAPTLPGESRNFHESGAAERVDVDGQRYSVSKGHAEELVEDIGPPVEPSVGVVTMSERGRAMLKGFEGLRLSAYPDAGAHSIGYGHLITPADGLAADSTIEPEQAEAFFANDVARAERIVARAGANIGRDLGLLEQTQKDALVSMAYNIPAAFSPGTGLMLALKAKRDSDVPARMREWRKAGGRVVQGLVDRRAKEAALFSTGAYP